MNPGFTSSLLFGTHSLLLLTSLLAKYVGCGDILVVLARNRKHFTINNYNYYYSMYIYILHVCNVLDSCRVSRVQ